MCLYGGGGMAGSRWQSHQYRSCYCDALAGSRSFSSSAALVARRRRSSSSRKGKTLEHPLPWQQQQRRPFLATQLSAARSEMDETNISSSGSTAPTAPLPSSSSSPRSQWDKFDYLQHWYPVSWVCDLRPSQPTKVTLFDVDYVVAVTNNGDSRIPKITALLDQCPHKAAALSEGRITASGLLQCAYHGWSFDGTTGACQQIPQVASGGAGASTTASTTASSTATTTTASNSYSARTCAKAIPAVIHQGMLWLWPGPVPTAAGAEPLPTPPTVPELDDPSFSVTRVVRDFPQVDWTLLVSNILDPDHGIFAHQTIPFDWYSASPEHPLTVQEESVANGTGWHLRTSVPAVEKLLKRDKELRRQLSPPPQSKKGPFSFFSKSKKANAASTKGAAPQLLATSIFLAPTTVMLSRRSGTFESETKFVTAFWVSPTGTGRSRFFSASAGRIPKWLKIPRWLVHWNLNNFLDQDTVLVASQQPAVLSAEARGRKRSSLFAYASPTDRSVRLIDAFWDATASRAPNRARVLQELYQTGRLRHTPDRRTVLDRHVQHLNLCPDSQGLVRNCRILRTAALTVAAVVATNMLLLLLPQRTTILSRSWRQPLLLLVTSLLTAWGSESLRRGFYFCYPEAKRNRDLRNIPAKTWTDS